MIRIIAVLFLIFIISCDINNKKNDLRDDVAQGNEIEYRGEKIGTIPKVAIVQSIYNVSNAALEEGWSRQTWVIRFGKPSSSQLLSNGSEIIRYEDFGPYQPPPAKYFLSGVNIQLDKDKTIKISYNHTSL